MVDDLKALRDEMGEVANSIGMPMRFHGWLARLTSIIERQEKERAFLREAAFIINNAYEGSGPDRPCGGQRWDELAIGWLHRFRALTEPAKEGE